MTFFPTKKMTHSVGHSVLDLMYGFISTSERSHCVFSTIALYYYRNLSYSSSAKGGHSTTFIPQDNGIGKLFRDHGEAYITAYKPALQKIKLIRSIRICRTPHFGGTAYECKGCGKRKYVYFSCGNSQCPNCQGIKRLQWQDKLATKMLKVPYQHTCPVTKWLGVVFTMPHRLNSLAKNNPDALYNILMRSAWSSLKECADDTANLGGLPGVVMPPIRQRFNHLNVHWTFILQSRNRSFIYVWVRS